MNFPQDLLQIRLAAQQIAVQEWDGATDLVAWMGAMQAQELAHAKAAVGLRLPGTTESAVAQAIAERHLVHTWAMRGTLHLVAAADVWWLQQLVGAAVMRKSWGTFLKGGLNAATLAKACKVLELALVGTGPQTRQDLVAVLANAGIDMGTPMRSRIFTAAAYEGLLCLGPLEGKQETFVWLEDWVPRPLARDRFESISDLAQRYFQSHGPATIDDFVAWSGLGMREASVGLEDNSSKFETAKWNGKAFFWQQKWTDLPLTSTATYLLPGFDEYLIGYRDRSYLLPPQFAHVAIMSNGIFRPLIVVNGIAKGVWKRNVLRSHTVLELTWFQAPTALETASIRAILPHWEAFWETKILVD